MIQINPYKERLQVALIIAITPTMISLRNPTKAISLPPFMKKRIRQIILKITQSVQLT